MTTSAKIAEVAALVGDLGRASMLTALMDGRARTATELAQIANVTASTASGHLGKLAQGGLVAVLPQGRHRYFRIASSAVAVMLESIMVAAVEPIANQRPMLRIGAALRNARTCYDHLAGRLGVALSDALVATGAIELDDEAGKLTDLGKDLLQRFGVPLADRPSRRSYCRPCLDWSERRPHLAGHVGAALLTQLLAQRWITRADSSRAINITAKGRRGLKNQFHLDVSVVLIESTRSV